MKVNETGHIHTHEMDILHQSHIFQSFPRKLDVSWRHSSHSNETSGKRLLVHKE